MKSTRIAALLAVTVLLGACAGPGALTKIPLTDENGQPATLVAHNQMVPDYMLDRDQLAINYLVRGEVGEKQLAAIAEAERGCRIYTKTVRPHNLVAIASSTGIYALAGYIGLGIGSKAFSYTKSSEYAKYGAWASGIGGAANGVISLGGQTYTFENCGERVITKLFPNAGITVIQKAPY